MHIGNRHAVEVANLALVMIEAVKRMPVVRAYHLEEGMTLEARAGIHSGGVVRLFSVRILHMQLEMRNGSLYVLYYLQDLSLRALSARNYHTTQCN